MTAIIIFVHLIMLSPVLLEGAFDKLMWKLKGPGKDKPLSTWVVRPVLFIGVWLLVNRLEGGIHWSRPVFLTLAYFGLFFPLFINWLLGEEWYHIAKTDNKWSFDYWIAKLPGNWVYLWIRIWLVITALCVYYQEELVYGFR